MSDVIYLDENGQPPGGRIEWMGGSDLPVWLGLSPFKKKVDLWDEKAGLKAEENLDWKISVQFGKECELGVINMFNNPALSKKEVKATLEIEGANRIYWPHASVKQMGASPDAWGTCSKRKGRGLFDVKTSSAFGCNRKTGKEEWHWQVMHQMACAPIEFDYGGILLLRYANFNEYELDEEGRYVLDRYGRRRLTRVRRPELKMNLILYDRDEEMMEACEVATDEFWESIRNGDRPDE